MCGFAGYIGNAQRTAACEAIAANMVRAIAHRGPDSSGVWSDPEAGIALGHCRLSIVDLSPAGHQPMLSSSGGYVMVFNGEIFNHVSLRADLENSGKAQTWHGTSDTEVLLALIECYGVTEALRRCTGMFAFALWDRHNRTLTLARDRLGEKPLYYGWIGDTFVFGSDLAALRRHPSWQGEIDRDAIALLLRHNCIPAPATIFRGISKVMPGSILVLNPKQCDVILSPYWDAHAAAERGLADPFTGSADEAVFEVERLLSQSIARQMLADVSVGAFLSGGIDSSAVVALMQAQSRQPVRTFTIGFDSEDYDKFKYAKAVARHLGTDHSEVHVTERDALAVVPKLASIYSEPFSDLSQIPAFLVSQLARQSVTVSLSGDGGDELFSGYSRYAIAARYAQVTRVPLAICRLVARGLMAVKPQRWDILLRGPASLASGKSKVSRAGDKVHKLAASLGEADSDDAYRFLVSHWKDAEFVVLGARDSAAAFSTQHAPTNSCPIRRMMFADLTGYLPDDILTKVDRASMAVSLEARVPMLDHALVEFALSLPVSVLRRDGQAKWPLRQLLGKHMPASLFDRPKTGFGVPLDSWLRGPLRDWAEALIDPARLSREGWFDTPSIRAAWSLHQSGKENCAYKLWDVLIFQSWLESQKQVRHRPVYRRVTSMQQSAGRPRLVFVVTEDWYFVSHRLALARAAKDAGYDVSVIARISRHAQTIRDCGLDLHPIAFDRSGMNPLAEWRIVAQLTSIYRTIKPDIVHHVAMKPALYGSLAARRARVPGVVNALMGLGYVFSSDDATARFLKPFVRLAFRAAMVTSSSRVIVQNADDAALLRKDRLAREEAIQLIVGSGVDLAAFPMSPEPDGRVRVVLPARLLRDKGIFEFIEAARILKADGVDAEFVLAGAPDNSNPSSVTDANIAQWVGEGLVTYLGWSDDMAPVLSKATIVCLPSYREGLPKVLLEAAATGRAIVTTDVPGCREVVRYGENGWLVAARSGVALADGLRRAIANPDLRQRYALAGRKVVEDHHSIHAINQQTLRVYSEILSLRGLSVPMRRVSALEPRHDR